MRIDLTLAVKGEGLRHVSHAIPRPEPGLYLVVKPRKETRVKMRTGRLFFKILCRLNKNECHAVLGLMFLIGEYLTFCGNRLLHHLQMGKFKTIRYLL